MANRYTGPPPMTFGVTDILDKELMENGPLFLSWGEPTEKKYPANPIQWPDPPRKKWRQRLRRNLKPWRFWVCLTPPEGVTLEHFEFTLRARLPMMPPRDEHTEKPLTEHKRLFLPGVGWYADAPEVMASVGGLVALLDGIDVAGIQIWAESAPSPTGGEGRG